MHTIDRLKTQTIKVSKARTISMFVLLKGLGVLVLLLVVAGGVYAVQQERARLLSRQQELESARQTIAAQLETVRASLDETARSLAELQAEDQVVRNRELMQEISSIQQTFRQTMTAYERILDLQGDTTLAKVQPLQAQFSSLLTLLSQRNYASASSNLAKLNQDIQTLQSQLAAAEPPVAANVTVSNTPPNAGYSRQAVQTEVGAFQVDILGAVLNSTRVIVDTASGSDCADNCPVASLADYVSRSGGFAGINGPYFCPAEYPSCAGKTNSFDTLLMNKDKVYFNSDNNVYSTVPAFIFSPGSARLVGRSLEWGRDTSVDAVIASQPMLIAGGEVAFGGDTDPKRGSRGSRSFIATKDNNVFIGVVRGATVAEVARVLKALGMQSALNLDSGGSTAFMVNGRYIAGPGRATPFGIVLVRR